MAKNMNKMLKQAQKIQAQMMEAQEEMNKKEVEGTAGGGMVKVLLNGAQELQSVTLNPEIVDPDDVEMLEDGQLSQGVTDHVVGILERLQSYIVPHCRKHGLVGHVRAFGHFEQPLVCGKCDHGAGNCIIFGCVLGVPAEDVRERAHEPTLRVYKG